jgi:putative ABC transport system substrate-binding protein
MSTRREFITLLGSAAAAWPLIARAQGGQARRVGVLMGAAADDPDAQANIAALHQGLQEAGWVIGSNLRVDVRWSAGDSARLRELAAELSRSGRTRSWRGSGRPHRPCCRRPVPFRSYSCT